MLWRALIWRPLRNDWGRTLLSLLAIALGVAVVVAIRVANRGAVASFGQTTAALAGGADLLVWGPGPLPATLLGALAPVGAEAELTPYLDRRAFDARADDTLEILGVDFVAMGPVAGAPVAPAQGNAAGIVLAGGYAHAHGYRAGDTMSLAAGGRSQAFTVTAVLPDRGAARAVSGDYALLDLPAALAFLAPGPPAFDGLRVRLVPGANAAAVAGQLRERVPAVDTVAVPEARTRQDDKMLAAFRANLEALSYVSLLVGVFLIYNTVSISVVRRRGGIAVARALGAAKSTVLGLFVAEGLALSLAGGVAGLGLGWALAAGAMRLVARTVNALYAASPPGPAALTAPDAAWALALAAVAGTVAALAPARQAAAVPPALALRAGAVETAVRERRGRLLAAAGVCALVAALLPCLPATPGAPPWAGFASALAAVMAWACLAPVAMGAILPRLRRRWLRRGWLAPGLAAGGLAGALRRSAVLTVALATAIGVLFGVAIMVGSFRQTVRLWIGQQLQADVFVRAAEWTREHPTPLAPALLAAVLPTPGLAAVQASHTQAWTYRGQPVFLNTRWWLTSPHLEPPAPAYEFLQGGAMAGTALVSEPFARRFHLWTGDMLALATPAGREAVPIGGVFYDYTSDRGEIVLPVEIFRRGFGAPSATEIALYAARGVSSAELRRRVRRRWNSAAIDVHDNASLRAEAMLVFDQTFRITYALEAITLLVAILGVANTLLAVVLERAREFAILRFLGATRAITRRILLAESALVGSLALALGAGMGATLAVILARVINVQSFGWTIQFHFPYAFLVPAAGLIGLATLAAGWLPARAAWRQDPLPAVAAE